MGCFTPVAQRNSLLRDVYKGEMKFVCKCLCLARMTIPQTSMCSGELDLKSGRSKLCIQAVKIDPYTE